MASTVGSGPHSTKLANILQAGMLCMDFFAVTQPNLACLQEFMAAHSIAEHPQMSSWNGGITRRCGSGVMTTCRLQPAL